MVHLAPKKQIGQNFHCKENYRSMQETSFNQRLKGAKKMHSSLH